MFDFGKERNIRVVSLPFFDEITAETDQRWITFRRKLLEILAAGVRK